MLKNLISFVFVGVFISSCASVNSVSLTPIPAERKNQVSSQKSKMIFLAFNFDNDFVDGIVADLQSQCPNGKVTGILTKDEDIYYFLFFLWKKQVTATGYCITNKQADAGNSNQKRKTSSAEGDI